MAQMSPEVAKAVEVIMRELGKYESASMGAQHAEPDGDESPATGDMPADEDCPDCAAGTCDNPDHMADADKAAMMKDMGGGY